MDWTRFDNHGESNNHAFEVMCNLLFESWCKDTYGEELTHFSFVNGDGGDGGVEAFASLTNGDIIAVIESRTLNHLLIIIKSFSILSCNSFSAFGIPNSNKSLYERISAWSED